MAVSTVARTTTRSRVQQTQKSRHEQPIGTSIEWSFDEIYPLDDIARRLADSPFTVMTTSEAVQALVDRAHARLTKCRRRLPASHIARPALARALEELDAIYNLFTAVTDAAAAGSAVDLAAVGSRMLGHVQACGASVERALRACGGAPTSTYLDALPSDPCRRASYCLTEV